MTTRPALRVLHFLPLVALALYGLAFAVAALGGGPLAGGDHPGQLYRVSQALTLGLAPWRLNPGWWAGYAELQYYPPGMAYLGALLHGASLGTLDAFAVYTLLLWIALLLPGFAVYALLVRVLGSPWLALPGGFLALTLSAGSKSGLEEGLRWGMVAARLGWGVLPLLALALHRWTERPAAPLVAAPLLAAVLLCHPAHWPAGVAIVMLAAWHGPGPRWARLCEGVLLAAAGTGLAGFWLLPLLAHRSMALPLAWGDHSLGALAGTIATRPLSLLLLALSGCAWLASWHRGAAGARWLSAWAPAVALLILADVFVAEPLGILWIPADRLLDSLFLAVILGACVALSFLHDLAPRVPAPAGALAFVALSVLLTFWEKGEGALSLWPRRGPDEWPKYDAVSARFQLPALWEALHAAPPGRVLFLRSSVPLEDWPDWWRPRTHVTALAPLLSGREILNGTFTHPSPIAGVVYSGSPANHPITKLVEERDGVTLFGEPLATLDARAFDALADQFLVSAAVTLAEDDGLVGFLERNPRYGAPAAIGPFRVFTSRQPHPLPEPAGRQRWRVDVPAHAGGWQPLGVAYSPLWRVRAADGPALPARSGELGLLEVRLPPGGPAPLDLEHVPGTAEWSGVALSAAAALGLAAIAYRRRTTGRR